MSIAERYLRGNMHGLPFYSWNFLQVWVGTVQ
jgi:hypothetical protein